MKVLFLSKYYDNYLDYFFSVNDPEQECSYECLYDKIIGDRYFWSDYFKQELPAYGYEVEQLIIDAKPLQVQWAKEHHVSFSADGWYFDILIEQIKYYKPEILFIQDWSQELGSDFIKMVKERCSVIKFVVGYCGEGHPAPEYFKDHDFVISCARDNVEFFRERGLNAYHIYHAFYSPILEQLGKDPGKESDLAFIGRIYPASYFHKQRALFLSRLAKSIHFTIHGEIQTFGDSPKYHSIKELLYDKVMFYGSLVFDYEKLRESKYVSNYMNYREHRELYYGIEQLRLLQEEQYKVLEMFDAIRRYKMLLNYHISPVFAANLRLFEVTGMGTCLITDWHDNITELFEPGKEIVTFKNVYEAKEKIEYLQNNPDVTRAISLAGQKRTLRDHTYAKRAHDMHDIFSDFLKNYYTSN